MSVGFTYIYRAGEIERNIATFDKMISLDCKWMFIQVMSNYILQFNKTMYSRVCFYHRIPIHAKDQMGSLI